MVAFKNRIQKNTDTIEFLSSRKDFKKYNLKRYFKIKHDFKKKKSDSDSKQLIIEGYAATVHKDRVDDIITLGALEKAKKDLLQKGANTVFFNHDRGMGIGKVLDTRMDDKGLIVKILISKADDVKDIRTKIMEGIYATLSIGGRFKKVQIERDEEGRIISFKVLELELYEVSVVGLPANPKAQIFSAVEKFVKTFNKGRVKMAKKEKVTKTKSKDVSPGSEEKKVKKVKYLTLEDADALIDKKLVTAIKPVNKSLKSVLKTVGGISEILNKEQEVEEEVETEEAETTTDTEKSKDAKNTKKKSTLSKVLDELKDTNSRLKKLEENGKTASRKGFVEEDEDEEDVQEEGIPEKALKGPDDPKSVLYVKYVMDNNEVYKELSDSEKQIAKNIYFAMATVATSRK